MKNSKRTSKYINGIIYIVLIGIIISLLIDENIIIGKEKQILKEMTQSENEANLQTQLDNLNIVQEEYAASVQAYKKQIAEAITTQGVTTSENDTGAVMAENIGKILTAKTTATAVAANILTGKTAWVNGEKVTGTMTDNGAVTSTLNAGGSYTIPAGYHNGSGKVTASTLESQTSGTATASDIASGKTAWVNGSEITGTKASSTLKIVKVVSSGRIGYNTNNYSLSGSATSIPNYQNLTANNFILSAEGLFAQGYTPDGNTTTGITNLSYTKSYNASTGQITFTSSFSSQKAKCFVTASILCVYAE